MSDAAIVIAPGAYGCTTGKVAHGLVRGGERFHVVAVVDADHAGHDAGELLDGVHRGIPVTSGIDDALAACAVQPRYCVIGVATNGGILTPPVRALVHAAVDRGMSVVNGLHDWLADDARLVAVAREKGVELVDLRRPRSNADLHFWTGAIAQVKAPRIAVLGTDCAIGKRTTAGLLAADLNAVGVKAEMIYTGQTGWMQGFRYGFILDSTPNDYVSGEIEDAILRCERDVGPDVILLEGQSALRNPSGPCGAELLLSGGARGVILQHAPDRECFDGFEDQGGRIPPLIEEIELIRLYGASVIGVALQGRDVSPARQSYRRTLQDELGIPVVYPLAEGVGGFRDAIRRYVDAATGKGETA